MTSRQNGKPEKVSFTFPSIASSIPGSFAHPSANNCHCSGVNALAVDSTRSILYSAGRDSSVRAWSFGNHTTLKAAKSAPSASSLPSSHETVSFYHMDHHSDWVNDITLACEGTRLVSCGSDRKISVCDVSSLIDDPWTSLLSSENGYIGKRESLEGRGMAEEQEGSLGGSKSSKARVLETQHVIGHGDYVKRVKSEVSYDGSGVLIFSVGLDARLKMHLMRPEGGPLTMVQQYDAKSSLYAMATSRQEGSWFVATGGADGIVKVFDTREDKKCVLKLKGHSDMVKSVMLPSSRPNVLVSGGSDSSIRIWDLRNAKQSSCLALHDDSVWVLEPTHPSNTPSRHLEFYSGSRDGSVYWTNVDTSETRLLFKEQYPILSLATASPDSLWVSTTNPSITHWELSSITSTRTSHRPSSLILASSPIASPAALGLSPTMGSMLELAQSPAIPLLSTQQAISKTPIRPSLASHHILPDKQRVVTRDTTGRVLVWNVMELKLEQDLGIVAENDSAIVAALSAPKRFLPSWFTAETRSGQLTIHIDPFPRCLDACFTPAEEIVRCDRDPERSFTNAAANVLKVLFRGYFDAWNDIQQIVDQPASPAVDGSLNGTSSAEKAGKSSKESVGSGEKLVEEETKANEETEVALRELDVIVTVSKDGEILWRGHTGNVNLDSYIPSWVMETCKKTWERPKKPVLTFHFSAKRPKIFQLNPSPTHQYQMHRSFTVAGMIEFMLGKKNAKSNNKTQRNDVTVSIQGIDLPLTMDLGTIKHFFWKSNDPIPLQYDFPLEQD